MIECQICNKKVKNKLGLSAHVKMHGYILKTYYRDVLNDPNSRCEICGKDAIYSSCRGFGRTCGSKECLKKINESRRHPEAIKQKIREKRIAKLKRNNKDTAWANRSSGKMSYLEQWFYDNVIIRHELEKVHLIVAEYAIGSYAIDFAFVNQKLAIEIDGKYHYSEERQEHDKKRDEFIKEQGWKIYRIPYFDIKERPEEVIKETLNIINGLENVKENNGFIKYKEYKERIKKKGRTRRESFDLRHKQWLEKQQEKKENLLNSDIDFSVLGWATKASKIIGIVPQRVSKWVKKVIPELYQNCYRRKSVNGE